MVPWCIIPNVLHVDFEISNSSKQECAKHFAILTHILSRNTTWSNSHSNIFRSLCTRKTWTSGVAFPKQLHLRVWKTNHMHNNASDIRKCYHFCKKNNYFMSVRRDNVLWRVGWYAWRKWRVVVRMIGFTTSSLNYHKYSAIAYLHTFQSTVAHALGFSVSISRRLITDLNAKTTTSNHC
jgi:hypothetical protein